MGRDRLEKALIEWFNSSGHMFMELDSGFKVVTASDQLQRRFGARPGDECFHGMYGLETACPGCPAKEIDQGRRCAGVRLVRRTKDDAEAYLLFSAAPLNDPDGDIAGTGVLIIDLPQQVRAQDQAAALEARYHNLLEHLPDLIFSLDPTGRITFVNPVSETLLGYSSDAMIGHCIWDYASAEDRSAAMTILETRFPQVWDQEIGVVDAQGHGKHVRVRCAPRQGTDGNTLGFDGVMRDRTSQHKLEQELALYQSSLKESEQRHRLLVEQVPDIIFSLDASGRFTFLNSRVETLLGWPLVSLLDRHLWDLTAPEDKNLAMSVLDASPEGIWDEEMSMMAADGRSKWVRIRVSPLTDSSGRITEFQGVMRDRTVRKKLEEDLKSSRQALMDKIRTIDDLYAHIMQSRESAFIAEHTAEVAHELRQPLAIIGGFARRMARQLECCDKLDPESQKECFRVIITEVHRLESILKGLVDFTRQRAIQLKSIDPSDLVEDVVLVNEENFREKDLDLELDFGDEVGEILVDPDRFQHVVRNLVANAIEASPRGGKIRIETGVLVPSPKAKATGRLSAESYFELRIRNQGDPIPPDTLRRVFDPFFSTKDQGTGLGLTVSKRIVEEHGGSISVKSDAADTIFSVWLPLDNGSD